MAVTPYVVQADCTVRGEFVRRGTLVGVDPSDTELVAEYGFDNLAPMPADQSGEDADHAELSN
jgi:hypothetical protein